MTYRTFILNSEKPVGDRLANYALADTYKRPLLGYQSPVYKSMQVEKGKIRISFDYAQIGLISEGGPPTQFTIAGEDRNFVPAVAKIDGGNIVVSAKTVKDPVAVRFCWDNTAIPNLYNKEGLRYRPFAPIVGFGFESGGGDEIECCVDVLMCDVGWCVEVWDPH